MADQVIASLVGRLSFEVDTKGLVDFGKNVQEAEKKSEGLTIKGVALGTMLGNIGTKALEGAAGLAKMAARAGVDLVRGFVDSTAALDTWARKMGTTTQELQRLEFAGASVGAEADNTREAFKTLTENLGELERVGSGPAVDSLATLGLTLRDFEGKTATEQMGLFADAMQKLPNDAERVSVALEIMGEDGGALLPLFQQGSKGIEMLADKADRLGLVLDEGAVEAAKDAKIALMEMSAQATAVGNSIAAKLAPKVTEVVGRIQRWYDQNKDLIDQKIDAFVEGLIPAFERVVEVVESVIDTGSELVDMVGGMENALIAGAAAAGIMAVAMGGLPAIMAAASAAIALGITELAGFRDEVNMLKQSTETVKAGTRAAKSFEEHINERTLYQLTDEQFAQMSREFVLGEVETGRQGDQIAGRFGSAGTQAAVEGAKFLAQERDRQLRAEERRLEAEGRKKKISAGEERIARAETRLAAEGPIRARAKRLGLGEQAIQSAIGIAHRSRTEGAADEVATAAAIARLDSLAGVTKTKGPKKVDTSQAEAELGDQIRALGQAAGANTKALTKAMEAAAQALEGGAAQSVALQAATSTIESLTGQKLSGTGGPDAALFNLLTTIGGPQAARTATEGARFVRIDQSVNIDVGGVELKIPEGWAGALTGEGMAGGTADALQRQLVERVFLPIVEQAQARGERP